MADTIKIESLSPSSKDSGFWKVREHHKQKRIDLYHWVVHVLAFLILVPYVVLTLFGRDITPTYATIVSVVVGFYFAKSLLDQ